MAVVGIDRDAEAGDALARALGDRARFIAADVTDAVAVQDAAAVAATLSPLGLRVSVACAGIAPAARIVSSDGPHDPELYARVIDVNLRGTFHVLRAAAAAMTDNDPVEGERGVHISTASVAAWEGQIGQVAYAASKAGVAGMTIAAARDLASRGVRVCSIAPGVFATAMVNGFAADVQESLVKAVPFPHRLGQPEEYADLVVGIVTNRMLNGETIRLDGALRMPPR
jgi:NAD(P)-dependent dehydrogenase (short-subunit alcohol dehydrogenase family)